MSITSEHAELVKEFGKSESDSGSAAVQVAILTERIVNLTEHLKDAQKDFGSAAAFCRWSVSAVTCLIISRLLTSLPIRS